MSARRVSRLPSLKAPSPHNPECLSPAPSTGQTKSRRTSITSTENGSLGRDGQLSDSAFIEQLEEFRRQLLEIRKEKKKLEDEIIKYKLLCKEKHQAIQDLYNRLEADKANYYDLKEQLTRDLTLQLNSQHASEKKKLTFDISILKNEKRKMESEIRLLETTNKGLFEEIRQIRSSYDTKMEKLMKDFHIEIYKESGEKRKLERKLQESHERLTREEYLAKHLEFEKERAESEASDMKRKRIGTFGSETGTVDRQNKKIAELEEAVRKLESQKTIAENQYLDLAKKLKEAEKAKRATTKSSPNAERKRPSKPTNRDKIDAADRKLANGKVTKTDLESFLKLAHKERNVLERKIAILEKTRQQTGDDKLDNEISTLRQSHRELADSITDKEKLLEVLEEEERKRKQKARQKKGVDREQQTLAVKYVDEEVQVEIYDEEEEHYDEGSGGGFMFQEAVPEKDPSLDLATLTKDSVMTELEGKINKLEKLREKDMVKVSVMSEKIEFYKEEITGLNSKAGAYLTGLEDNTTKLNTSYKEIEKLNEQIKDLKSLNTSLREQEMRKTNEDGISERQFREAQDEVDKLTKDIRDKQITVMKLHQELHEASEEIMDKSSMVRQLEVVCENLKHDNELMREEQFNAETTNEEVLDKLRSYQMRCNQTEELVKSLEADIECNKRENARVVEQNQRLQTDKERLEVEVDEQASKLTAREIELESALSDNPTGDGSQATLDMLQELRQKDNSFKKIKQSHNETLGTLKKEIEKQVKSLQNKIAKKDKDIAKLKTQHNVEKTDLLTQMAELDRELEQTRDVLSEKEQEIDDIYNGSNGNSADNSLEMRELNKRLAELANENMTLRGKLSLTRPRGRKKEVVEEVEEEPEDIEPDKDMTSQDILEEEDEEDIGEISVALVLYSYDPVTMSPNDYPEDELEMASGDFIYIFGDPDVDGFYTAELMSGLRGLVPCNFIQIVELNERKTQQMRRMSLQNTRMSVKNTHVASSDVTAGFVNKDVPVPSDITCDCIGDQTLEVQWELGSSGSIVPLLGFRLFVNSQEHKVTSTGECRCVLKDLPAPRPLYLTIQTMSSVGDSHVSHPCIHGREAIKAPESLDVTNVTTNSAVVTFVGQPHYHHSVFSNGDYSCTLKPGEFVYQLKELRSDTEYEIRIVTQPNADSTQINQKTSQSTTFLTEIGHRTSSSSAPLPPDSLTLTILDQHTIKLSWSPVEEASSYQVYINSAIKRSSLQDTSLVIQLADLNNIEDEQSFYVVTVNERGDKSVPSELISFFKSELFSQLSVFFPSLDKDNSITCRNKTALNSHSTDKLSDHFEKTEPTPEPLGPLARVVQPHIVDNHLILIPDQIISVEQHGSDYRTIFREKLYSVPRGVLTPVAVLKRVVALYDYVPQDMSPNSDCERELAFKTGDVISIYEEENEGLFYKGVLDNTTGLVPSNFVIDLEAVLHYTQTIEDTVPSVEELPVCLMAVNSI